VPDDAVPAATVIVVRDAPGGVETLLLRRNSNLGFAAGMWVFPGGRVDEDADAHPDAEVAARRAAVREAREEAGIDLDVGALVPFAHWTPDRSSPHRRFATWFFVAAASTAPVVVDGGEIVDHVWVRAADALELHATGEVELLPPTWVTLFDLAGHDHVAGLLAATLERGVPRYRTRMVSTGGMAIALWAGDIGYEAGEAEVEGRRHRLLMGPRPWRYVRT
jgi:8-oxo-dGTP pyrophosphatase MutT (NUDIX family)